MYLPGWREWRDCSPMNIVHLDSSPWYLWYFYFSWLIFTFGWWILSAWYFNHVYFKVVYSWIINYFSTVVFIFKLVIMFTCLCFCKFPCEDMAEYQNIFFLPLHSIVFFSEIDHSDSSARIVSEQNKFSENITSNRDWTCDPRTVVVTSCVYSLLHSRLSWQVLIEGSLTPLLFVHQLTFWLRGLSWNQ